MDFLTHPITTHLIVAVIFIPIGAYLDRRFIRGEKINVPPTFLINTMHVAILSFYMYLVYQQIVHGADSPPLSLAGMAGLSFGALIDKIDRVFGIIEGLLRITKK